MARPRKQEVDYFPHYCDHGKTLFILENRFQNDGYAVFYKIEEILAKTEGHCYDCSRLENWEYLLSKMGTTEEVVLAIIDKLADMDVIDKPLWQEKRLWMQSFVDSIGDAYARRKVNIPEKPELMSALIPLSGQNDGINPQSKVKESKVKKSKEKSIGDKPRTFIPPKIEDVTVYCQERDKGVDPQRWYDHYTANGWMVGKNKMKDWKAAVRTWEDNKGGKNGTGNNGRAGAGQFGAQAQGTGYSEYPCDLEEVIGE
jgi:hypothetical protein